MPKRIEDLMKLTGRSRRTVIREIEAGNMPGYRVGGNHFHIPDEAFELYSKGYWSTQSNRAGAVITLRVEQADPKLRINVVGPVESSSSDKPLRHPPRVGVKQESTKPLEHDGLQPSIPLTFTVGDRVMPVAVVEGGKVISVFELFPPRTPDKAATYQHQINAIHFRDQEGYSAIHQLFEWMLESCSQESSDTNANRPRYRTREATS